MNPKKSPVTTAFGGGGLLAIIIEAVQDPASLLKPENIAVISALLGLLFARDDKKEAAEEKK